MTPVPHRVRRLFWQVRVGSTARALEVRRDLRARLDDAILPALERAFDAAGSAEVVVHIPRLTLNLRVGDVDDLVGALAGLIEAEVREALAHGRATPAVEGTVRRLPTDA